MDATGAGELREETQANASGLRSLEDGHRLARVVTLDTDKDSPYCKENPYQRGSAVITSKLTSKAQTTIPQPIRAALRLREGDELVYEIQGDRVVLSKAQPIRDGDDPFRTFNEWDSAQTARPMAIFRQGDVVKVPFPYTDRSTRQSRRRWSFRPGRWRTATGLSGS